MAEVEEPPIVDVTVPPEITESEDPVVVPPGADLPALVEASPEGTAFILESGIHRGHFVEPKDGMRFTGEPGAIMTGAVLLSDFVPDGDTWILGGIEATVRDHGRCIEGYEGCSRSQDLFMDDVMLWQVTDEVDLEPGSWLWEDGVIRVADDPTGRRVELSVEPYAFRGSADDVTIESLTVQKYATPAQEGAIQSQEPGEGERGRRWRIDSVDVSGVHGAGIRAGDDTLIIDSRIHRNGQLGVTGAGGTGLVIESTEITDNNTAGFSWEWEAGGVKITNSFDVTLVGNYVADNLGPGLWGDLDNVDMRYLDNTVVRNGGPGIFHEICGAALIEGNLVEDNGYDKTAWLWGAGILVAASSDTEVTGNIVRGNVNAITGIQQERGEGPFGPRLLSNLLVHRNTITPGSGVVGIATDNGDDDVFTERNNRFEANTYIGVRGRAYRWMSRSLPRQLWVERGNDVDGIWLDEEPAP